MRVKESTVVDEKSLSSSFYSHIEGLNDRQWYGTFLFKMLMDKGFKDESIKIIKRIGKKDFYVIYIPDQLFLFVHEYDLHDVKNYVLNIPVDSHFIGELEETTAGYLDDYFEILEEKIEYENESLYKDNFEKFQELKKDILRVRNKINNSLSK